MGKRAVLVGCNYPGTNAALNGCVNDVKSINNLLTNRFGFSPDDIQILIDTDQNYTSPTGRYIHPLNASPICTPVMFVNPV